MTRKNSFSAASLALVLAAGAFVMFLSPARALTNCTVSPADLAVDSEEAQMLTLINAYRQANGRAPLALDPAVTRAAAWMSRDMAANNDTNADHLDSLNRDIPTRLTQCDVVFTAYAENLAWGNATAQATFTQWQNSPVHNTNMLRPEVNLAGIARSFNEASTFDWYWVLDLTAGTLTTTTTSSPSTSTTIPGTTSTTTPTSTSTSTSTSTTAAPTTTTTTPTSSTTSTTVPATTSTSSTTATTQPPPTATQCANLTTRRAQANAQITAAQDSLRRTLSGAELDAQIARYEAIRAAANADFERERVRLGCPPFPG